MAVKGLNSETFTFSAQYQSDIISAMIQNPELYTRVGIQIEPKYFELKEYRDIFKTIKNYYSEFIALPSQTTLTELVSRVNNSDDLESNIDCIYKHKIKDSDVNQIENDVSQFISYQAMKKAIMNCADLLSAPENYNQMKSEIDKALLVGASLSDTGIDVYSDEAIITRWDKRKENSDVKILSTGWENIDEVFGGGLQEGTISSVMACANIGKSFVLVNIGANALLQQKNILHISLEMSEESVIRRYDSRLLGLTSDELKKADGTTMRKLRELLDQRIGKLFIKQFPAITLTADELNAFIERLENVNDLKIDLLIVDYADIMKSGTSNHNERRFELEKIYMELRNIALERKIPVLTATQLSREGLKASKEGQILDSSFIAESYGIARHLDNAVTINATPQDVVNHTLIFYISKNRQGAMGQQIRMYCDFSKALIKPWTDYKGNNIVMEQPKQIEQPKEKPTLKTLFVKN